MGSVPPRRAASPVLAVAGDGAELWRLGGRSGMRLRSDRTWTCSASSYSRTWWALVVGTLCPPEGSCMQPPLLSSLQPSAELVGYSSAESLGEVVGTSGGHPLLSQDMQSAQSRAQMGQDQMGRAQMGQAQMGPGLKSDWPVGTRTSNLPHSSNLAPALECICEQTRRVRSV